MRQVPPYCIVGLGRLGKHIAHYLSLLGIEYVTWHRGQPKSLLLDYLNKTPYILLCIPDDAIELFIDEATTMLDQSTDQMPGRQHSTVKQSGSTPSFDHLVGVQISPEDSQQTSPTEKESHPTWIHFSGVLQTSLAYGLHPLMTFSTSLYDIETYRQIPLIAAEPVPEHILSDWPNLRYHIPADQKIRYHAWCALAGNGTSLLWQQFNQFLQQDLNLPDDIAQLYCSQVFENITQDLNTALTGPMTRGDVKTLAKHHASLEGTASGEVYQAMRHLFEQRGSQ